MIKKFHYCLALILLCLLGCAPAERSKVVGEWKMVVDEEASQDLEDRVGSGDGSGRMSVVFHRDGTLETRTDFGMAQGQFEGTWQFVSSEDDGNVVVLACELKGDNFQTRMTFEDSDTIRMIPPNLSAIATQIDEMKFKRQ